MIPRSRQPGEFDAFCDPRQGSEREAEYSDLFDCPMDEPSDPAAATERFGSSAGEEVMPGGRFAPTDFSSEELTLARELNRLYSLEQEDLPPLFVQTLAGDMQHWMAPSGLAQRVTYQVFRRLHLYRPRSPGERSPVKSAGLQKLKRATRTVGLSTVLALLLLSMVTVVPSFAAGWARLLLQRTGVQMMSHYPQQTVTNLVLTQYLSLREAQEAVPFQVYWLGESKSLDAARASYRYQSLLLHMGQQWADGPVVEVQYRQPNPVGMGLLSVREFRPAAGSTVLLVVANGSAHFVHVGEQVAVYINGRWVRHQGELAWEYGTQAELLYQTKGLIFWITADQRDGATPQTLVKMVGSLEQLYLGMPRPHLPEAPQPPRAQRAAALSPASLGEVVSLVTAGASPQTGATVYIALGQPPDADA